jgi:ferrous iron transport protein B
MQYDILTVGNPNSGKTTLFNGLTGSKQQVGNWAGVTVEKKTGRYQHNGDDFSLTDLPGIYNLDSANDANSLDEAIASRAILTTPADVIINVVDASSLERSLYMTLQLRELGRPMVVVLNKMDVLKRQQQVLDLKALEKALGCPVVALSANNMERIGEFKSKLHKMLIQGQKSINNKHVLFVAKCLSWLMLIFKWLMYVILFYINSARKYVVKKGV